MKIVKNEAAVEKTIIAAASVSLLCIAFAMINDTVAVGDASRTNRIPREGPLNPNNMAIIVNIKGNSTTLNKTAKTRGFLSLRSVLRLNIEPILIKAIGTAIPLIINKVSFTVTGTLIFK